MIVETSKDEGNRNAITCDAREKKILKRGGIQKMNMIRLSRLGTKNSKDVLINLGNVDFINPTANHFGDEYVEVHCGNNIIDVKESLDEIESIMNKAQRQSKVY